MYPLGAQFLLKYLFASLSETLLIIRTVEEFRELVLNRGAKCDFCSLYCQYTSIPQRLLVTFNEGEKAEAGWVLLALCPGQL